jgi:hypothetical protein
MAVYRAQITFPADTALPRDQMSITPHYTGDNASALADWLKASLIAWPTVANRPFKVKVYDAEKAKPNYPLAVSEQTGTVPNTGAPREVCLCLSYFSTFNRKGWRGRLYLPAMLFGGAQTTRPTPAQMQAALDFHQALHSGRPPGVAWVIWSRKERVSRSITNLWVDDEWDIQRSRGMRGTTRVEATI